MITPDPSFLDDSGTVEPHREPSSRTADVIVVGGGPAGSVTALLLARSGHHVVLLERAEFPRPKPCGECLSPEAARVLDRLGLLAAVELHRPAHLRGWKVFSAAGRAFEGPVDDSPPALAIQRERLDSTLLDAARAAGAEIVLHARVTDLLRNGSGDVCGVRWVPVGESSRGGRTLLAPLVVGADGLRSVVARRLGLVRRAPRLRKLSLTAHVRGVQDLRPVGEMHLGDGVCFGLAPVERSTELEAAAEPTCNLTLVVDADRYGRDLARNPLTFFAAMGRSLPSLGERLQAIRFLAPAGCPCGDGGLLASGPFDVPVRTAATAGAALVGDAAGYYDPFTGQGIYHALAGAELLAAQAERALRNAARAPVRLPGWGRAHRDLMRDARWLQRAIEQVIARPRLADWAIARLARTPEMAASLLAVTGDLRPLASLLSPALLFRFLVPLPLAEASS